MGLAGQEKHRLKSVPLRTGRRRPSGPVRHWKVARDKSGGVCSEEGRLWTSVDNIRRSHHRKALVAGKVFRFEDEVGYAVRFHRGSYAGVVNLKARNPVMDNKPSPFLIKGCVVGDHRKQRLDASDFRI